MDGLYCEPTIVVCLLSLAKPALYCCSAMKVCTAIYSILLIMHLHCGYVPFCLHFCQPFKQRISAKCNGNRFYCYCSIVSISTKKSTGDTDSRYSNTAVALIEQIHVCISQKKSTGDTDSRYSNTAVALIEQIHVYILKIINLKMK